MTFFYPSFHLRDPRVPRPPMTMLDSVRRLVLEADIVEAQAHRDRLTPYLLDPAPRDLATLFTPKEIARIRSRAACNGLSGAVDRLRLSFIATIVALPCPKAGDEGGSYEEGVEIAAQQRGLKVIGLETAEEQLAALAGLPDRLFIGEIKDMAAHPDDTDETVDRMIALYNGGDIDGLYKLMLSTAPKNAADRQLFIEKILLERNRHMVERLGGVGRRRCARGHRRAAFSGRRRPARSAEAAGLSHHQDRRQRRRAALGETLRPPLAGGCSCSLEGAGGRVERGEREMPASRYTSSVMPCSA